MSIPELRATSAMPVYEPPRRLERRSGRSGLVPRDPVTPEQPTPETPEPRTASRDRDRFRAHIALVILWAGLIVAIVAYALARESIGALILALFVAWLARVPWASARSGERDAAAQSRQIAFVP
jgi:hypothetical protein